MSPILPQPHQPNTKKRRVLMGVGVFIVIVVDVLILSMYFLPSKTSKIIPPTNSDNIEDIFVNIPQGLLQRDSTVTFEPTAGYFIMASIISHKKDRIAYAEIRDCIKDVNDYDETSMCDWNYRVSVKNIQTGKTQKIYSYPEEIGFGAKKVQAGGCPIVYVPIAWSNNDQKIILQWINPTSCGSGGAPKYLTYTINSTGGVIENLSTYEPIFLNEYEKVVYVDESPLSPLVCGPVTQANNGKIVLTHIESKETTILLEEPNSEYSLLSADEVKGVVEYSVKKVLNVNGCSEVDTLKEETVGVFQIP